MKNYEKLAKLVYDNMLKNDGYYWQIYEDAMAIVKESNSISTIVTFEDDDFDNYVRVSVSFSNGENNQEVGTYSLVKCNDVSMAIKMISQKFITINDAMIRTKDCLKKLNDSLPYYSLQMLKMVL